MKVAQVIAMSPEEAGATIDALIAEDRAGHTSRPMDAQDKLTVIAIGGLFRAVMALETIADSLEKMAGRT